MGQEKTTDGKKRGRNRTMIVETLLLTQLVVCATAITTLVVIVMEWM
jgi:hypothetical protein